jgi:predicted lipoprotein
MSQRAFQLFLAVCLASGLNGCGAGASDPTNPGQSANSGQGGGALTSSEGGEGDRTQDLSWGGTFSDRPVIATSVDQVILPKYQNFATSADSLAQQLNAFANNPSDATLTQARQTWKQARADWEKTESFAFGPAGSLGYDAALDSWPVNEVDVTQILNSQTPMTPEAIAQLQDEQKGMHTIELLLFGQRNDKTLAQFTERDRQYLAALGTDLKRVATALLTSWQTGVNGQPAYRTVIATAGEGSNEAYPTLHASAQELVTGIIDCVAEVGTEKLGAPIAEQSSDNLESRFSFNTLADLQHNLQGAQAVYLGTSTSTTPTPTSLSAYIAKQDPAVDQQVKADFQAAIQSLKQLPGPLETKVTDPTAAPQLKTAQAAIATLQKTLETKVVPLI